MAYSMDVAGRAALFTAASGGLGAQFGKNPCPGCIDADIRHSNESHFVNGAVIAADHGFGL